MTIERKKIIGIACAAILLATICLFTFGRRSKVVETVKQKTATILKKEYIPDQHIDLEKTLAFAKTDSVYDRFRQQFRMHFQTLGTATFPDSSRLILIAEPAPFFETDTLEKILQYYRHLTLHKNFKIGYDGRVTDLMIVLGNATNENVDSLIARISRHQFQSDYKSNAIDLQSTNKRHYFTKENLDYQITLAEFDDWFFQASERFIDNKDTSKTLTINQIFKQKRRGVFFSQAPGLVAWSIRRHSDLEQQIADIRQFALDADLILGALRDSTTLVIIGREREASLSTLPPLRVESVLLMASISQKELSQSLDVNDCMAGKMSNGHDWCPTYLSKELENTEVGHLLTITDVLLKDWSENGTIQETYYRYPSPGYFPFDKPLFKKLGLSELVYNWNTANTMYAIDQPEHTIYTLNRTGALPVSYFNSPERSTSVGHQYELQAGNYFARCNNTDLARVVQYTALYQLFMDNGVHYAGKLVKNTFPKNKPYLLEKPCRQLLDLFKGLSNEQIEQLADTLSKFQFKAFGEKEVQRQMRENETQYNFTYTEEYQKSIYHDVNLQQKGHIEQQIKQVHSMLNSMSRDQFEQLARYLSYPRGIVINNEARYRKMLQARQINELLRLIGKDHLTLLGMDLTKVKDYYVANLSKSGSRYLKTPSVIITFNDWLTTGGHNISSKISRVNSTTNYKAASSNTPTNSGTRPSTVTPSSHPSSPTTAAPSHPATNSRPATGNAPTGSKPIVSNKPSSSKPATTSRPASAPAYGTTRSRSAVISTAARSSRGF